MKNRITKQTLKIMTVLLLLSVFISSCKKEEADDPNIIHRSFNKTVVATLDRNLVRDSLDVNADGVKDFAVLAVSTEAADTTITYISAINAALYVDSTQPYFITYKAKNMFSGEQPELLSTKTQWYNIAFTGAKTGPVLRGYAGVGDVYIPVIFSAGINKYYGWININVSNDYRTLKVIDGAYHINPDTPIKMGAK